MQVGLGSDHDHSQHSFVDIHGAYGYERYKQLVSTTAIGLYRVVELLSNIVNFHNANTGSYYVPAS